MQTKLTLRLDNTLIKNTKLFAKQQGLSLSQLVSHYFSLLNKTSEQGCAPVTHSLRGVLKTLNINKDDYKAYLEDKYL
ncbi:MAG: DUF6364 family protein [Gammaproteobacteria bacterium]|nr:DUF6364 family protein [Gammaproteobacteria bacterium]